jgi:protein-S-isoprenylcysteine O-methyltransferase Ste14
MAPKERDLLAYLNVTGPRLRRRPSDWIGFVCFSAFALVTVSKMPAVGVLLAPTLALECFAAASFLIREPPRAAVRSARARLAAYGGTFLLLVFIQVAHRYAPAWLTPTTWPAFRGLGALLWIAGSVWSAYSIWYLRHAFSIEPEARRLITSGPYRVARHPIYSGYLMQYAGMWLLYSTVPFAVVLVGWLLLVADRIRHEERVLAESFPEYADYCRTVGALGSFRIRKPLHA